MRMRHWNYLALLLLAAALLCAPALAAEGTRRAIVVFEEGTPPEAMEEALGRVSGAEVLWRYERLFSGAAVEGADLDALAAVEGVEDVLPVRERTLPQSAGTTAVWSGEHLERMGLEALWEAGYDGGGTVIAVVDSGVRTSHAAFGSCGQTANPALSPEDIEDFAARGRTEGTYVSDRIPFAFDYHGRDGDVSTTDGHGTHVAGLAAGYVQGEDGEVLFRGAAPAAQLLCMKVFPDGSNSGADDAVILRALEDAWNLGADVVNLSLGSGGGFSADGALDGLYSQAFARLREAGVLLCCAAGNGGAATQTKPRGALLPSAAYPDYGTVCSPAAYLGNLAVAAAEWDETRGAAVPADYSSWGTTSDLRLVPALSAFGGPLLSAASADDAAFIRESGTSMASGTATGSLAVLLQVLRERGVTDRAEAAGLAERLLESTAQIMTDGDGVPYSPRKQGAGLLDLSAAAASPLVLRQPLLELGEGGEGRFSFTLVLENLSEEDVTAELDAVILTDAYEEQDGVYRSLLSPLDIRVTLEGAETVTIPAGGTREVPLTLTVDPGLRRELEAVFPNGFFVEGYLTAAPEEGPAVHATLLGFCGDWGAAPILETTDFRDAQQVRFQLASQGRLEDRESWLEALDGELGANLAYVGRRSANGEDVPLLGENGRAYAAPDSRRSAVPGLDASAPYCRGELCYVELYTLRNAARVVMVVSDPEGGEVYYADDRSWLPKSGPDGYTGETAPSACFSWDGGDAQGAPLPDGTRARVDFFAWLDSDGDMQDAWAAQAPARGDPGSYQWLLEEDYGQYLEWSFPVTVDGAAPDLSAHLAGRNLTLTIRDNQFTAYAAVRDDGDRLLFEDAFFPGEAGEAVTVSLDLSDYDALPGTLYVTAEDYASNAAGWSLDLNALAAGEAAEPERCAMALLTDVDRSAWYHEAVDYVWDRGLMEGSEPLTFQPTESATRAHIVTALHRLAGSPTPGRPAADLPFTDAPQSAAYLTALRWAWEKGLVDGYGGSTFAGPANVTRQQLAVLLHRFARLTGPAVGDPGALAQFPDGDQVSPWARDAMSWAASQGLLGGRPGGSLDPRGYVTRAEAAQVLARMR